MDGKCCNLQHVGDDRSSRCQDGLTLMYLQHCERKPADFVQHELGGAKNVIIGKAAMQNAAVSKFRVGLGEFDLRSIS